MQGLKKRKFFCVFLHKKIVLSFGGLRFFVYFCKQMETALMTKEELIANVLNDIRQKGYSSIQPFSVGKVEERMLQFSQICGVTLASDELYMSAKQLQHCMRASKGAKGLVVDDADLIGFPQNLE